MADSTTESLNKIFSIAPELPLIEGELLPVVSAVSAVPAVVDDPTELTQEEKDAKEDFEYSRSSLKAVANESQTALHRISEVAMQTDNARAFEVVADLIRATVEVHRELQDIHHKAAETRIAAAVAKNPVSPVQVDKGVIFTGTPDDLLRMLSKDRS